MTRSSSRSLQRQHRLDLVQHHLADRDAGPAGHHLGDRLADPRPDAPAASRPATSPAAPWHARSAPARSRRRRRSLRLAAVGLRACRAAPESSSTRLRLLRQLLFQRAPAFLGRLLLLASTPPGARRASRRRPVRAPGCRSRRRDARSRGGSPPAPAGVADWLRATRAQAVSSRLTDLSGSCRSVM